jgi:imidazoleglycerol phosphate dehydratase HisB
LLSHSACTAYVTEPFWSALVDAAGIELDLRKCRGDNAHHITEATFKSFARCLRTTMDQMEGIDVVETAAATAATTKRAGSKARSTKETTIDVALDLDGAADASAVSTGIATLDEMLAAIASEAGLSLHSRGVLTDLLRGPYWLDIIRTGLNSVLGTAK